MAYAILRFEKHSKRAALKGSAAHMMRTQPTPNADPQRTERNRVLVGTDDPVADVDRRIRGAKRRKDSVLAVEVLATASPEWWQAATKEQQQDWTDSTIRWLKGHFGDKNVVHLQLHLDETSPHITGLIAPVTQDGRLGASRWFDGAAKLAAMQTGYAEAVAHLGLERGIEGSKATHQRVRRVYGALDAEPSGVPSPAVETPPVMLTRGERENWAAAQSQRIAAEQRGAITDLAEKAGAARILRDQVRGYQQTGDAMKEAAAIARDIPLHDTVQRLGLKRDKYDKVKWRDDEGRFAISLDTDGRNIFNDHHAEQYGRRKKGGRGSIDLVMHVLECGYQQAVAWLGYNVDPRAAQRSVVAHQAASAAAVVSEAMQVRPPYTPPVHDDAKEMRVKRYLIEQRGLPVLAVNALFESGRLRADSRGNAVFVMLDGDGREVGAELRGTGRTPFQGAAPGTNRDGCFVIARGEPRRVVMVESAIDAASWLALHPRERDVAVVSTAGARATPPLTALRLAQAAERVTIAFDNDPTGQAASAGMFKALTAELPGVAVDWERPERKDWNEDLTSPVTDAERAMAADAAGTALGRALGRSAARDTA